MHRWVMLLLTGLCIHTAVMGQKDPDRKKFLSWLNTENDSAYIEDHTRDITFRLFGSRKYTYFDIGDRGHKQKILYRPNNNFNIGFGANYKFLGLNIGLNLPFINNDDGKYGKTKYLDLQSHIYLRKLVVDFYGQYYKGYYIANPDELLTGQDEATPLPKRPDLYNLTLGLSVQYLFNDKRFSYRAAFLQNEYQKKSAGSFIVGGQILGVSVKADSSLIPTNLARGDFFDGYRYYRTRIISGAANAGYAYTFVYRQHFFLTLSLTGGLGVNHTRLFLESGESLKDLGWQFNNTVRVSAGYNSSRYFFGIHYVDMATRSETPIHQRTYQTFGTGNFRVSLVRRFALKRDLF